ncbi:MAG: LptF/LptG family permease, partial [Nitrospinae bacterium]|nr:LptF/LptG family permease [Nitrospinota bacterium]
SEGYDATRYKVDFHTKFAFPLISFVMAMLAVPFSIGKARSWGTFVGIGVSIIIGFTAWVVMSFGISLGRGGLLPPFLAAWFGNFVFMSAGFYFLLTSRQ